MFKIQTILMAIVLMAALFTVTASADTEVTLTTAQLEQILNSGNVTPADSMTITVRVVNGDAVPLTPLILLEILCLILILAFFGTIVAFLIILIAKLFSRLSN